MSKVPADIEVVLQIGFRYGVLTTYLSCSCCDEVSAREYLFHNDLNNRVIRNMDVLIQQDQIQLYLPHGAVGCFDLVRTSSDCDDSYILRIASHVNLGAEGGAQGCIDMFFEDMHDEHRLKYGFRRFSSVIKRSKTRDTRLFCLWFLTSLIEEPLLRKEIIVSANLW